MTVRLQDPSCTLSLCRRYFDGLINKPKYNNMSKYLGKDAEIVKYPDFENGIVKIQRGQENSLTVLEAQFVEVFLKPVDVTQSSDTSSGTQRALTFAESIAADEKRMRLDIAGGTSKYQKLDWITCTSNDPERLFSYAKLTNHDNRQSTTPKNFEARIYLKYNREFWDEVTVQKMLTNLKAKEEAGDIVELEFENIDEILEPND